MTAAPGSELVMLQQAVAGRYAVERELGRGGMGVVFLAHDLTLDRPVAIKLLAPTLAADRRSRQRFLQEARAAARLSHPHIVPIHSVEDQGDVVFFVMSYVDGETLGQRVRRAGPLPRAQASRIMQEVTWALGMAHAMGIIHRDVKPDNILLERATGRALVMDFGIAHLGEGPVGETDGRAGTPHYMSPEQAAGDPVDGRSDIYSLGVTMFFALTGERPFEEPPTPAALLSGTAVAPTVSSLRPDLSLLFAAVVDRCLSPEPSARYDTAEDVAAALVAARPAGDQTPVAVAGWVMDAQAAGTEIGTAVVTAAVSVGVMGVVGFDSIAGFIFYPIAALLTGMGLFRFGDLAMRTRQLRLQGYGEASVAPALTLEQRRIEEEATLLGKAPAGPFDIPIVFLATTAAKTGLSVWLLNSGIDWLNVIGAAGTVLFPASAVRQLARRWPKAQTFWSRMLGGRLGRLLFWVADRWPGSKALPAADAPTAVLLGGAAVQLYRALAPARQVEFGELPALLRHLEADALAAGDADPVRRAAALSALEAIRLDLLRMQAGDAVADQLTEDLGAARQLADRVDRLLQDGTRQSA